ncbi:MAG: hypothetical protein NTX63_01575 [Candidatus Peregrinibacteria bacterium]|nr:hypothetical protein [Candidatus Peregrinibacteria bacterium]
MNSPTHLPEPVRSSQDPDIREPLCREIAYRFENTFMRRLFLILLDHLQDGMHRQTLRDEYEMRYGEYIDIEQLNSLNGFFMKERKTFQGEPETFQLEMYKSWFRIVPPEYSARARIEANRKRQREEVSLRVRSQLDASLKRSWKMTVRTA